MRLTRAQAVLATLSYADVFGYPLTSDEISVWCVAYPVSVDEGVRIISELTGKPQEDKAGIRMFFLSGRNGLARQRFVRSQASWKKLRLADASAMVFRFVPTVRMVAVTGGVAAGNAKDDDDIDLLFVLDSGTLWTTRLILTLLAEICFMRRRPNSQKLKNMLCLNMFLTVEALTIPGNERNLYTAHEALHLRPLWERDRCYRNFLERNDWIRDFLPNAWLERMEESDGEVIGWHSDMTGQALVVRLFRRSAIFAFRLLEPASRVIQLLYMKRHLTTEVVNASVIRFHPRDMGSWVKAELGKRLRRFNIPLDNVFYGRIK